MKSVLRALLAFLERKFPDRVVVTEKDYRRMVEMVDNQASTQSELVARVVKLEFEANKFNMAMGFGNTRSNMMER